MRSLTPLNLMFFWSLGISSFSQLIPRFCNTWELLVGACKQIFIISIMEIEKIWLKASKYNICKTIEWFWIKMFYCKKNLSFFGSNKNLHSIEIMQERKKYYAQFIWLFLTFLRLLKTIKHEKVCVSIITFHKNSNNRRFLINNPG